MLLQFLCTTFNWPIFNYCKYLIQFILRFQYGRQHEFWRRQSCSLFHSSITSKSQLMSVMKNLSQSQHYVPLHSIPVYSKGDNSNIKNWSAIFVVDTCGLHPCLAKLHHKSWHMTTGNFRKNSLNDVCNFRINRFG